MWLREHQVYMGARKLTLCEKPESKYRLTTHSKRTFASGLRPLARPFNGDVSPHGDTS